MKRLLAAALSVFVAVSPAQAEVKWSVARHEYKGFPLFLRYAVGLNYDALQPRLPFRIVVTLRFAEVLQNGLPESKYNNSLEQFDEFLTHRLSTEHDSQCVLVETFGGKRMFYAYAAQEAAASVLREEIRKQYPKHEVTVEVAPDPKWSLIRNYATEYFPKAGSGKHDG